MKKQRKWNQCGSPAKYRIYPIAVVPILALYELYKRIHGRIFRQTNYSH
jgi:hypothetical protein